MDELRAKGLLIEHEGALWFSEDGSPIRAGQGKRKTSDEYAESDDAPEEKGKPAPIQAVVIRSATVVANPDERATYFASDIPYALNKVVERGFNPAVYVWGEDHQADVPRVYAAARVDASVPIRLWPSHASKAADGSMASSLNKRRL